MGSYRSPLFCKWECSKGWFRVSWFALGSSSFLWLTLPHCIRKNIIYGKFGRGPSTWDFVIMINGFWGRLTSLSMPPSPKPVKLLFMCHLSLCFPLSLQEDVIHQGRLELTQETLSGCLLLVSSKEYATIAMNTCLTDVHNTMASPYQQYQKSSSYRSWLSNFQPSWRCKLWILIEFKK